MESWANLSSIPLNLEVRGGSESFKDRLWRFRVYYNFSDYPIFINDDVTDLLEYEGFSCFSFSDVKLRVIDTKLRIVLWLNTES